MESEAMYVWRVGECDAMHVRSGSECGPNLRRPWALATRRWSAAASGALCVLRCFTITRLRASSVEGPGIDPLLLWKQSGSMKIPGWANKNNRSLLHDHPPASV